MGLSVEQRQALLLWFDAIRDDPGLDGPGLAFLVETAATGMARGEVVSLLPNGCVVLGTWDASTWGGGAVWDG